MEPSSGLIWNEWATAADDTISINGHTTSDKTWTIWTGVDYGTGSTDSGVWQIWTDTSGTAGTAAVNTNTWIASGPVVPVPQLSEEEIQARLLRQQREREEWERRRLESELKMKEARIEASALLDSILNDIQRRSLEEEDWFLVIGRSGAIYRLRRGRVGNIDLISPDGKLLRSYCVHPGERLPNPDDLVAQKLHLETNDGLALSLGYLS